VDHSADHVVRPAGPEVADILRDHAYALKLTREQLRAVIAIVSCRTARLGGHIEICKICGFERNAYNSCRNRQCPKCQILKQELWAEAQERRLLPIRYFHATFTIAGELRPLFRRSPKVCLKLLFEAASETLIEVAERNLHVQIGFTAILHTWNQKLRHHPHIHFIVPGGGLAPDGSRFVVCKNGFLLPARKLRRVFKGKLLDKLKQALRSGAIRFSREEGERLIRRASRKTWGVKVKLPLAGPRQVVRYLSRYVHRVAIANSRILAYDGRRVTFRYKDRADENKTKTMEIEGPDFARRFLQHVLPDRFIRIRHYGFLAARSVKRLELCRRLLGATTVPKSQVSNESWVQAFQRIFHRDPLLCPRCKKGRLIPRFVIPPLRL
jgi:predicted Zn-ribbon and HTH transcriptional regulator